jgi:dolichol-phosphate mannosyltransferase
MNSLVIIPVFNEKNTIRPALAALRKRYRADVLLIDDGSSDGSADIIAHCVDRGHRLHAIYNEVNKGYGFTLREGFRFGLENGYEVLVTMDCDCQHEPSYVPLFLQAAEQADVVSGSRYLACFSNDNSPPESRLEVNIKVTALINEITGFGITDAFCGFKAYNCSALKKLHLTEDGYAMPLEFWIQAFHCGLTVKEIAVPRIYLDYSRSFGVALDDKDARLRYYKETIEKEKKKWGL